MRRNFETIKGEGGDNAAETEAALLELAKEHACGIDVEPQWCVYGRDGKGAGGVLFWVRPREGDAFIARRMAHMINDMGGDAEAQMTEWNDELDGDPVYERESPFEVLDGYEISGYE